MEALEAKHKLELQELADKSKAMLKGVSKKDRIAIEAQIIQMEFDLKAKHREEEEALEMQLENGTTAIEETHDVPVSESGASNTEELKQAQILAKKAKNQRKKDRKHEKEQNRTQQLEQIKATAGTSLRETELASLNMLLKPLDIKVKEVVSDGHCLYRSIADQLKGTLTGSLTDLDKSSGEQFYISSSSSSSEKQDDIEFIKLRKLAADHIRQNAGDYAPFIGCSGADDPAFEAYCRRVENVATAEWGGQIEIRALSECLQRPIYVYEVGAPVVKMGEEYYHPHSHEPPIYLTYHKHYYALGEHYNSVTKLID